MFPWLAQSAGVVPEEDGPVVFLAGRDLSRHERAPNAIGVTRREGMPVSRTSMLAKLSDAYAVYFDAEPVDADVKCLAACYAFHSADECFVLSRKVRLWRTEINEFVYVFSVPELTADIYDECRGKALELGMKKIRPHIEHKSSFITALFICDCVTKEAAGAVRGTRHHKDFLFSLHGWMDFRAAALDLASGAVAVNRAGRDLTQFLLGNLGEC